MSLKAVCNATLQISIILYFQYMFKIFSYYFENKDKNFKNLNAPKVALKKNNISIKNITFFFFLVKSKILNKSKYFPFSHRNVSFQFLCQRII